MGNVEIASGLDSVFKSIRELSDMDLVLQYAEQKNGEHCIEFESGEDVGFVIRGNDLVSGMSASVVVSEEEAPTRQARRMMAYHATINRFRHLVASSVAVSESYRAAMRDALRVLDGLKKDYPDLDCRLQQRAIRRAISASDAFQKNEDS